MIKIDQLFQSRSTMLRVAIAVLAIAITPAAQAAVQATYYVSPTGSDSNAGTLAAPFLTIQKARDVVRTVNSNMTGDIIVYLRGGRYPITSTLTFVPSDSGTNGYYIGYMAYNNEDPVVSGGKAVIGWTLVAGKSYYVANVPVSSGYADYYRQIYVNGVRAYRASGPWIAGTSFYDNTSTSQTADGINFAPALLLATYANKTDIRLLHVSSFKVDEWPVVNVLTNGSNIAVQCSQPFFQIRKDRGFLNATDKFMIVNALEELNRAGEWYHDRAAGKLYYYPYASENMSTAEVIAPALASDQLVSFVGTSMTSLVKNIAISGVTFEHGNWTYPGQNYIGGSQAEALYPSTGLDPTFTYGQEMPGNIFLHHTSGIKFELNTVRHMGGGGIHLYNDVSNTLVQGNIFYDTTGAGIVIGRFKGAYLDNDIANEARVKDNTISNNVVRDTGRDFMQATGISIMPALRTTITHNDVDNAAFMGIHSRMQVLGNYTTGDTDISQDIGQGYIAFNKVGQSNWASIYGVGDNASIYSFGPAKGTVIYQNLVRHNSANYGVYNDDNSYQITWRQNIILGGNNMSTRSVSPSTILFDGNYSTGNAPSTSNCVLTSFTKLTSETQSTWPAAAQTIANGAGLEAAYAFLLTEVPATPGYEYLLGTPVSLANAGTKSLDSGGWGNVGYLWNGSLTAEASTEVSESWVQYDLQGDYDHFVFTFNEDNGGTYQATEWKVQRWSASSNAWIDIMAYQPSATASNQTYTPASTVATTNIRLYVRNTSTGGKVGAREFTCTGISK
jgi:hypothetical protein